MMASDGVNAYGVGVSHSRSISGCRSGVARGWGEVVSGRGRCCTVDRTSEGVDKGALVKRCADPISDWTAFTESGAR